jgi:4-amino-4-deoxy-L-arabinose transferase-like glycosyltransferase
LACGAFVAVAALVAKVDRPASGLVTLLIGFATPYATYVPINLNHNIGLMPFWAAALATGWFAFEGGALMQWALFGLAIGLGLWAKYAILHLIVPLAVVFFIVPQWRRQTFTLGPWLALLVCAAVIAPQAVDVVRNGSTTIQYATRTLASSPLTRLVWIGEFALDCALAQATMAIIALVACGRAPLIAAIRAMTSPRSANRFDVFCNAAAVGPVLVILVAAIFAVHPHYLWITAPSLSFALWWGRAAGRAGFIAAPRRVFAVFAALAALYVVAYVGIREIAPRLGGNLLYVDSDGPALAALAERYWSQHQTGPIPYIVTFDQQGGFQVGGSIVFDLPYRIRLLPDNDPANAPWIDVADLRRRGALIVATRRLTPETRAQNAEIQDIQEFNRPMMARGAASHPIFFAILPPNP